LSLVRRAIVNAFRDTIRNSSSLARKNVSTYRVSPNWFEDLPAINIYPTHESGGAILDQAPLSFKRKLQITIECVVSAKNEDDASDLLDTLMDQVEEAIGKKWSYDKNFRCLFNSYFPTEVEFDFADNGKQIIAGGKTNYEVEYISEAVKSKPILDALERFGVTYSVSGSTTTTEGIDEIPQ